MRSLDDGRLKQAPSEDVGDLRKPRSTHGEGIPSLKYQSQATSVEGSDNEVSNGVYFNNPFTAIQTFWGGAFTDRHLIG